MMPKGSSPPETSDEAAYIRQLLRRTGALKAKEDREKVAEFIRSILLWEENNKVAGAYIIGTGLAIIDFKQIETTPLLPGTSLLT